MYNSVDMENGCENVSNNAEQVMIGSESNTFVLFLKRLISSFGLKLFLLGIISVILQIPVLIIDSLKNERERRKNEVVAEITSKWGSRLEVGGVIIYTTNMSSSGKSINYDYYVPETLNASSILNPEVRHRGIYQAVVYTSNTKMNGFFEPIKNKTNNLVVKVFVGMSQLKGITSVNGDIIYFSKDGSEKKFNLMFGATNLPRNGISAILPDDLDLSRSIKYDVNIYANGSESFGIVPIAEESEIEINSPWGDPSFIGEILPKERIINKDSFSAKWSVGRFATNDECHNPKGIRYANSVNAGSKDAIGVDLRIPIATYQQIGRILGYSFLFILILMTSLLLVDRVFGVKIHLIQYGLFMSSPIIFYLLLLSLGEHIGFGLAYLISALAIIISITLYTNALSGVGKIAKWVGVVISVAFALMYIILSMENIALLMGSITVFFIFLILLVLTAKMNKE